MDKYFASEFSSASPTFDTSQFGDLELVGTILQYHEGHLSLWDSIGVGGLNLFKG